MSYPVISVEHLTKQYELGVIGTGTLSRDLNRWWARARKQPDPYTRIGQQDAFARVGESILALNDVSFTVQQGEALGIIGRNGAGKSTLLKILSRVTAPTSGCVKVKGRIGSLLEVGTGFHPELTGRENVYLNGAILGMKKTEVTRKFDEIIDFSGVEKFIDTPVKRYSSGMYVRLAFAVAAHLDPEILIVDEVLAVGDADFQKKCLGKMGDVAGEGRTVLFVSHNLGMIKKLCARSIILNDGAIEMIDETEKVVNQYLDASGQQRSSTIELPSINKINSNYGRGLRLFITDETKKPRNEFKIGEKWIIRFEFQINQSLKQVISATGIIRRDSIPIITNWTQPKDLEKGTYFAEFLYNTPFAAERFSVVVGLSESERPFYYLEDAGTIEVVSASVGEQPFRTSGTGVLVGNHNNSIIPMSETC